MSERLRPSFWSAEEMCRFCDECLADFDARGYTFGDLIEISAVMSIGGVPPMPASVINVQEYQDRKLVELKLVSAFKDRVLRERNRCLRQQGAQLRVLHPKEQVEYGEIDHTKAALQKLRRGQRIICHADVNDVQARNNAIDRLKNVEAVIHRQATQRQHPF